MFKAEVLAMLKDVPDNEPMLLLRASDAPAAATAELHATIIESHYDRKRGGLPEAAADAVEEARTVARRMRVYVGRRWPGEAAPATKTSGDTPT